MVKDGGKGLEIFNQNLKKYEVIKETNYENIIKI